MRSAHSDSVNSAERRRWRAIRLARQRRSFELEPLRREIAAEIDRVGWRKARPVLEQIIGRHLPSRRIALAKVGKRNAPKLVAALGEVPSQQQFSFPNSNQQKGGTPNGYPNQ